MELPGSCIINMQHFRRMAKPSRPQEKTGMKKAFPKSRKPGPGILDDSEDTSQKYRDIIENLEDIIFAVDPAARVQYISPNVEKFLGYKPEEIIGEIPVKYMPPEEARLKYVFFANLASRHKKITSLELKGIHKDGRIVSLEANAAPYFSRDGAFLGYRGVCRDMTARRRMEDRLKAGRQRLKKSVKDLELMNRIASILLTAPDDQMYAEVLQQVIDVTQSRMGVFGCIDENGDVVASTLTRDVRERRRIEDKPVRFPRKAWTDTVWVRAFLRKKTVISNKSGTVLPGHIPVDRAMVTPIVFQDRAIGYLKVANRPYDYNVNDQALLERIAGFIAPALDARLQRDFEGRKRKAAEEALKKSQQDLKHAQEVSHTGSWQLDLIKNELSWSEEAYKIFDVPEGTPLDYEFFLSRVHPDDRERMQTKWREAVPGEIYDIEFRILAGSSVKWVRGRTELEFEADGRARGGFGTIQDISAGKKIEESLRESEERFRSLFHKGAVPMAITATDSRLIAVNPAYCEMVGYSDVELKNMSFYDITHPDDHAENKVGIDAVVNGERDSFRMEKRYIRKDGVVIWIDMSTASVRDASGKVLYIVTHAPEITVRKHAEQELIESQRRFSRSFYASPLPTVISTIDEGRLIDFNERWLKTLGYTREEMIGRTVSDLSLRDFEQRRPLINKLKRKGFLKDELIQVRTKSGQVRDVLWSAEVINFSGDQVMLSQFHDLTERKRMEQDLRDAKEKLETKVQERTAQLTDTNRSLLAEVQERKLSEKRLRSAQKNLRAMAAEIVLAEERSRQSIATDLHDTVVQTLGAAKLRTELLREHVPEQGMKYLNELRNMLSQSITEARLIMAEMSPPVLYELGFSPAVEWLAEQVGAQHDLDITVKADDHEPSMHEVQVLLFQAARELLMNVVKHSKAGKALVSIKGDKKNIRVTVRDDGKGFDGNVSFRTDSSSGFGLFSIRERLKHLGGRLVIKSRPGRGTSVSITAPRHTPNYPNMQ